MKKSNLYISLLIGGVLLVAAYFLYRQYSLFGWGGYGNYHMGRGMPGYWGMGLLMPLFWVVIIVWLFSLIGRRSSDSLPHEPDAVEILRQRYARGEIDKTEFKTKMADLE